MEIKAEGGRGTGRDGTRIFNEVFASAMCEAARPFMLPKYPGRQADTPKTYGVKLQVGLPSSLPSFLSMLIAVMAPSSTTN